jgi:2-polyprenyl-6-methoxyphenol hydroxylase-like FAD-dependent oxidoreductase
MDIRFRHLRSGLFGLGIHRGALFSILMDAMVEQEIEIRTGFNVESIEDGFVRNGEGLGNGEYDLIVVADGARSNLRSYLDLEIQTKPYSYGALWASVTNWGDFPDNVLRQSYRGTRDMMGLLPSGRLGDSEGRQISLFWSIRLADVPAWRDNGLDRWKRDAVELMPGIEDLLSQIESEDQITVASYYDVRTWSPARGHCVLIGDAAHASSPQLGQGASLALFDAMLLSDCLTKESNVIAALLDFKALRRRQVRYYQLASKWMTPFFQSGQNYLAFPRDLLLGPLCRFPWFQRQMVATMAGLKAGLFRTIPQHEQVLLLGAKHAYGKLVDESAVDVGASLR